MDNQSLNYVWNSVAKKVIIHYEHFHIFPQCFQRLSAADVFENAYMRVRVNTSGCNEVYIHYCYHHFKASPLLQVRWRHSTVETPEDIARTVTESSRNGHNIPQLVDDPNKPVIFFDWVSFLKKLFRPIPSLKKYHHFRFVLNYISFKQEHLVTILMLQS